MLSISKGNNNIIRVNLQGYNKGKIIVNYEGTKIQKITQYISIISFVLFTIYLIYLNERWVKVMRKRGGIYERKAIYNNTNV